MEDDRIIGGDVSERHRQQECDASECHNNSDSATFGDVATLQFVDRRQHITVKCGKLPHWYQHGSVQFVTFRLADSMPQTVINKYKSIRNKWLATHPEPWDRDTCKQYYNVIKKKMDWWVEQGYGKCVLAKSEARQLVVDSLEYYNGTRYLLHAYVIMPNHVHLLLSPISEHTLAETIGSIKRFTATAINKMLGTTGPVWQREMFDRLVRNEQEFERYVRYIQANPAHLPQSYYAFGGAVYGCGSDNDDNANNHATFGDVATNIATFGDVANGSATFGDVASNFATNEY